MDLLGDIGNADQLSSARGENAVLAAKVKELSFKVAELELQNQTLLAEVEMYRAEAGGARPPNTAGTIGADGGDDDETTAEEYIVSGNGVFPSDPAVTLDNLHNISNPLCCTLHPNDSLLATGGADSNLVVTEWGAALSPSADAAKKAVDQAARISCNAPVICTAFAQANRGMTLPIVAAGCMDGSVQLVRYGRGVGGVEGRMGAQALVVSSTNNAIKHGKYVRCMEWAPTSPILASAAADGTVYLNKIKSMDEDTGIVEMETVQTLHLSGAVESLCFLDDHTLCAYVRGTPHLSYFDLNDGCKPSKLCINSGGSSGGFEDHVSFTIMDMSPSPIGGGMFLAAATDNSRNIIFDSRTAKHVRNLYGHQNDGYSQPKIAWSSNGQYLFGNTQHENSLCVWDIASSSIVKRLGGHTGVIRDMFSSSGSDTLVTVSYDKSAKVWLNSM